VKAKEKVKETDLPKDKRHSPPTDKAKDGGGAGRISREHKDECILEEMQLRASAVARPARRRNA